MKVAVLAVGKVKERFFGEAIKEYVKRLGRYCRPEVIQVADEPAPEKLSKALAGKVKDREGKRLLGHIKEGDYVVALDLSGTMLSSEEFSEFISRLAEKGIGRVVFVIGGSIGLGGGVLERADFKLSFSRMTFPHQLMRVVLLEQIYRAFKIAANEPYHK